MKKIVVGLIIAVIAIITLVIVWGTGFGATPYYETETAFGMWQEELYVVFADGANKSLKLIDEGRTLPFTVKYQGQEITSIGMGITAAISGVGYTGAELKFESFGATKEIRNYAGVLKETYDAVRRDGTLQIALDESKYIFSTTCNLNTRINQNLDPTKYPDGKYTVEFIPIGTVKYRGYPDGGDFVAATLPPVNGVVIDVTHAETCYILVTLGSELA